MRLPRVRSDMGLPFGLDKTMALRLRKVDRPEFGIAGDTECS